MGVSLGQVQAQNQALITKERAEQQKAMEGLKNLVQVAKAFIPKPDAFCAPLLPGGCFPAPRTDGLSLQDYVSASKLHGALNDPFTLLMGLFDPDAGPTTLHQSLDGSVSGPEGQPLIPVKTDYGNCYVDPNTNQYYLAEERGPKGRISATGPMDLPEGVEFPSSEYYTKGEVEKLSQIANPWHPNHEAHDRRVASRLPDALGDAAHNKAILHNPFIPTQHLDRGFDGTMHGPEGQPLITVKTRDGHTAYVDPNTNQYYLKSGKDWSGAEVKGPMPLPPGSKFSDSYFTPAECRELSKLSKPHWLPPQIFVR